MTQTTFLKGFSCKTHGEMIRVESRKTWTSFKTLVCTGCERAAIMRAWGVVE